MGWAAVSLAVLTSWALAACTSPVDRPVPLLVSIDGDRKVRGNTVSVEVVVEAELTGAVNQRATAWETVLHQTLKPEPVGGDWPWEIKLEPQQSENKRYNLTATARDGQGAVVARSQALRTLAQARRHGIRVYFDGSCLRRIPLCEDGSTCVDGACVDASSLETMPATEIGEPPKSTETDATDATDGVAAVGGQCQEGKRACADRGSRTPLHCEGGSWVAAPDCLESERCDSSDGPGLGSCQPVASDCQSRMPNVPYCEGEVMRVCQDLIASVERACAVNERCFSDGSKARCDCSPGYVKDPSSLRCARPSECGSNAGGCDSLTRCVMTGGKPSCSACPAGYAGSGEQGCAPLLQDLSLSEGKLEPALARDTFAYRVHVPLLVQRVTFTPSVPAGSKLTLNGAAPDAAGSWTTPVLMLGETRVDLTVTSASGVSSDYRITLERSGTQESYIKASNADATDQFGFWVDISGDTLLSTAWFEDSDATGVNGDQNNSRAADSGAAYVFVRDGGSWKQQAYLKASDTKPNDFFGVRADLDGDTIVVGAIHESIFETGITATRTGAAYVYVRNNGVWAQTQRLAASNPQGADLFGAGVALDGDTLAIGAPWESTSANHSGAVYIYERVGSMWVERQVVKSSMPGANAFFGSNLDLDGDRLVVGAPDDNRPASRTGSAEIFARKNGTWSSQQFLQPTTLASEANFGFAVAVHGDRVVVGAPSTAPFFTTVVTSPGEVYVFDLDGDRWRQSARLHAPISRETDCFGMDVVLTDSALLIGASGDASGARGVGADPARTDASLSGAAYLYSPTPSGWVQSAFIKPHNTGQGDAFGYALALDGETLVISANLEDSAARGIDATSSSSASNSGAIYVFR